MWDDDTVCWMPNSLFNPYGRGNDSEHKESSSDSSHPGTSIKREVKNKIVYISLDTVETATIFMFNKVHVQAPV